MGWVGMTEGAIEALLRQACSDDEIGLGHGVGYETEEWCAACGAEPYERVNKALRQEHRSDCWWYRGRMLLGIPTEGHGIRPVEAKIIDVEPIAVAMQRSLEQQYGTPERMTADLIYVATDAGVQVIRPDGT